MTANDPPAQEPTRVLVVDDQRVVREGLLMLLGLTDGLDVVGAAADGQEALAMVEDTDPDVVLMDLNMPRLDGIEATRRLADSHPHLPVVVLTTYTDDDRVFAALRAGARGYLTKDAGAAEIHAAITAATSGQAHLDPDVQRRLLDALRAGAPFGVTDTGGPVSASTPSPGGPAVGHLVVPGADGLTPRELDVVRHIAAGHSNAEIAATLFVSEATVKTHINHIFAKTGVRDRAQLVAYAFRAGIADPTDYGALGPF
jgi:DNA-binding NarL/FixJ family response regulator